MTNCFWIDNIRYSGEGVASTTVNFKPGFNIVHGPSDTGKTYLAKTIKYMLAGSTKPFPSETGYSVIAMTLRTIEGTVKLTRTLGSSKITVAADPVFRIPYDDYPAHPSDTTGNEMTVSDILLRLIGVNEPRQVLTNQYGSRKQLTWKTFYDSLHRSEGRITAEESIFSTAKYATLSAFITLFYDHDLSLLPEHEDPANLKTRKDILLPHLDERLNWITTRITELHEQTLAAEDRNVTQELTALLGQLTTLTQIQDSARAELTKVTRHIADTEQELAMKAMSARHYEALASVYVGNIKRLTFVTDAQDTLQTTKTPATCPFCDNPLAQHQDADFREAARAEAETIAGDLEQLTAVRASLDEQTTTLEQRLTELRDKQRGIEQKLSEAVLPQITRLRDQIQPLEEYQTAITEQHILEAEFQQVQEQMSDLLNSVEPASDFNPADHFPPNFYTEMTRYLREILTETHYANADQAVFDTNEFDIKVGYKAKRSHGKGYRAFFNTIMVLALRRYIHEHANHKPTIVVLDTPTLGLEHQKSGTELVTSRDKTGRPRTGLLRNLFDYMVDTGEYGQLIILNNTDVTPTTHFDRKDTTELVFGEHDEANRPGLLTDIQEGNPGNHDEELEQPKLWDE